MQVIQEIAKIREEIQSARLKNKTIALVPTMGNLHDGHLALVKRAKEIADYVVVSIFVNPLQFAPHEDFAEYPRTLLEDTEKLTALHTDLLFIPDVKEMYPQGKENHTQIIVPKFSEEFCGKSRPGFFQGVATVVAKLFNIVQPDVAVFGEKDYQQLLVVKKLVDDLSLPIKVHSVATIRDIDNLALSSRNRYLSQTERKLAPRLFAILQNVRDKINKGYKDFHLLEKEGENQLREAGFKVDYFAIRSAADLSEVTSQSFKIILTAVWINNTRLIDNIWI